MLEGIIAVLGCYDLPTLMAFVLNGRPPRARPVTAHPQWPEVAAALAAGLWGCKCQRPVGGPARHHAGAMLASLLLLAAFARAAVSERAALAAENVVLRQQLAVLTRPTRKRPRLRRGDKVFWVLARRLWRRWSQHLAVVRPETVIRWHRQGWRLFWRWRSRPRLGRPRLGAEVRGLIAAMARDNPRWGSERIRGELLKGTVTGSAWQRGQAVA